jgi:tetratricopeptide (TPR) repeat protein
LSPKGDVNWNTLGHYYQKTGQLGKAVEAYKTSINNAPYYLSYEDLALLYFTNNNPQTKDFISNSLKKFPRDGYLWFLYSLTENKLEHKEAAIEAARYMIAYFPDGHAQLLYNLLTQNIPVTYKVQATKDGTTVFICYSEGCF